VTKVADFISSNFYFDIAYCHIRSTITDSIKVNDHLHVPISIIGRSRTIYAAAMIDSGASTLFINDKFVALHNIRTRKYPNPIRLLNIDGTENESGSVTDYCILNIEVGGKKMEEIFTVAGIGHEDVIIGIDWLRHHDPKIGFKNGTMEIPDVVLSAAGTDLENEEERKIKEKLPERYWKYVDLFRKSKAERLPEHKDTDHAINLKPDFVPTKAKPYPLSKPQTAALEVWTADQLRKGYIRPSKSPMSSPFFWVQKPGTTEWIEARPCQDYRKLNAWTIKDNYPMPMVKTILEGIMGDDIWTKLDIRWAFNNCRIKKGHEWKAAFVTTLGLFEPTVAFFGLANMPATFQREMERIFYDLIIKKLVAVYFDDILVKGKKADMESHWKIVEECMDRLVANGYFLKLEKCEFDATKIEYLGLVLEHGKISMDPKKVQAIKEWPNPRCVLDIQGFVGLCNYYRKFIKDFGNISKPLNVLTEKAVPWSWTTEHQACWDRLKEEFLKMPNLATYMEDAPLRLEVDASGYATGGVLLQQQKDGEWKPLGFISKSFNPAERNYDIYDKEMLAIIRGLGEWRNLLMSVQELFEIWSDHKNLEYWRTARNLTRRQARWALELSEFSFLIVHKPGKGNVAADALSRRPDHYVEDCDDNLNQIVLNTKHFAVAATRHFTISATQFAGITILPDHDLLARIRACTSKDNDVAEALKLVKDFGPVNIQKGLEEWNSEQGLIIRRGKVYVPLDNSIRRDLVSSYHDVLPVGHPGQYKTLEIISRNYWWPGMTKFINEYVDSCDVCNRNKQHRGKPYGFLKPIDVSSIPWKKVASDFIVKLPISNGFDSILTVGDMGTKQIHFIPCNETCDAAQTADLYIKNVFKLHGVPETMLTDRGPQFTSQYIREIYKGIGVKPTPTTAYHPQGDGFSERWNAEVEQFIRIFCDYRQNDWADLLPMAEFAFNSRVHSATGKSPFFMNYGYDPEFKVSLNPTTRVPESGKRLELLLQARKDAQSALNLSSERMKYFYDKNVRDAPHYKVGDKVWLSAKNITTTAPSKKLAAKQLGPYRILSKVGELDYELDLPVAMKIHPIFHVQLLHPHTESNIEGRIQLPPPPIIIEGEEEFEVEKVLDSRLFRRSFQYLVKWKGFSDSENTWQPAKDLEHAQDLIEEFHTAHPTAYRK
jgi:hypothetical protein